MPDRGFGVSAEELCSIVKRRDDGSSTEIKKKGGVPAFAKLLNVNLHEGIDCSDVEKYREQFGANVIKKQPPKSLLYFFMEALQDSTLVILCVSAFVSIILGLMYPPEGHEGSGWVEGTAILIAVVVVSTVTAVQNYSKELQFFKLTEISEDRRVRVRRGGSIQLISTTDLVVGDVIHLEMGDYIPADCLLLTGNNAHVDQATLTGESESVEKNEDNPFLLSGCMLVDGVTTALVVAVGERSVWGNISALLETDIRPTPLQEKLEGLAEFIGKLGLYAAIVTFVALCVKRYIIDDYELMLWSELSVLVEFVITGITIIVVAVPEGLPLAVTLSLAYSMFKMMKDQNLVRHLAACETMGGATVICSDKTGTLTQNRMTVVKAWISGEEFHNLVNSPNVAAIRDKIKPEVLEVFSTGICLNSTAFISDEGGKCEFVGAKTECALLQMCGHMGVSYRDVRAASLQNKIMFPFSSFKKRMSTIANGRLYVKGAAESILDCCSSTHTPDGKVTPLTPAMKEKILKTIDLWAMDGLRTLTVAYKSLPKRFHTPTTEKEEDAMHSDLILSGIVGIEDPLREEVPEAVRLCKHAGIKVKMLTGDNKLTAATIARRANILHEDGVVLEGPQFRKMTDAQVKKVLPQLEVIARCSPEDKLRLVELLKGQGEVVAVTGDGTNDAPQLREADVGFAMGIMGTEVAKNASDIILLDDNFSSIVKAVMWGRNVFDSIRKFVQFQLTVNVAAVAIAFIGAISKGKSPLNAVQLLWVNLIMDTMAALALATEQPTPELLNRPPYGRSAPLITRRMWRMIIGQATFQLLVLLFTLYADLSFLGADFETFRSTIVFNAFVFCQVFNEFNSRKLNDELNAFSGLGRNAMFIGVLIFTVVTQYLIISFGGKFTETVPLSLHQWLFCVVVGSFSIPIGFILRLIPVQ